MQKQLANLVLFLLFSFLLLGQLLRIQITQSVALYPHDLAIIGFLLITYSNKNFLAVRNKLRSKSLVFFVGWILIAVLIQVGVYHESWRLLAYVFRMLMYGFFLFWLINYLKHIQPLIRSFFKLSGLLLALITLGVYSVFPDMRLLRGLGFDDHYYRAVGSLLDPNLTAAILSVSLVSLLIWMTKKNQTKADLIVLNLSLLVSGVALGFTFSRSGWLGFLMGAIVLCFFQVYWWWKDRSAQNRTIAHKSILTSTLTVFVVLCSVLVAPKPGGEGVKLDRTVSIVARQSYDSQLLAQPPVRYLIGTGLATVAPDSSITHARLPNNFFFLLLTFSGIPGIVLFINLFAKHLRALIVKRNLAFLPILTLLFLAQFNAVATEPFVVLLTGIQSVLLFSEFKNSSKLNTRG